MPPAACCWCCWRTITGNENCNVEVKVGPVTKLRPSVPKAPALTQFFNEAHCLILLRLDAFVGESVRNDGAVLDELSLVQMVEILMHVENLVTVNVTFNIVSNKKELTNLVNMLCTRVEERLDRHRKV